MAPVRASAFDETALMHHAVHLPELSQYLYLGDWEAGADKEFAKQSNIRYVVRCCGEDALGAEWPKSDKRHTIRTCFPLPVGDVNATEVPASEEHETWRHAMESCLEVITKAVQSGQKVLVHDLAGERRAAAVCVAWAAIHLGWSVSRAVKVVGKWSKKAGRPVLDGGKHPLVEMLTDFIRERCESSSEAPAQTGAKRVPPQSTLPESKKAKKAQQCPFAGQAQIVNDTLMDIDRYPADVPEVVRRMLAAGISSGLLVPSEERHEIQATVVKRIGQVLSGVSAGFADQAALAKSAVEKEISNQKAFELERDRLIAVVAETDAAVSESRSVVEGAAAEMKSAETIESQALSRQEEAQEACKKLDLLRGACADVHGGAFKSLVGGEWSHASLVQLKSCLADAGAEDSLLLGVAPALGKKSEDRTNFDDLVVQSTEKFFTQKQVDLERDIAESGANIARLTAVATDASAALARAKERHTAADMRLNEAVIRWSGETNKLSQAEDSLTAAQPAIDDKSRLLAIAEKEVMEFQLRMDAFDFLAARKGIPTEKETAAETQDDDVMDAGNEAVVSCEA